VLLGKNLKLLKLTAKVAKIYFVLGLVSMAIGGVLMAVGFNSWYERVQKPLDAQLRLASTRQTTHKTGRARQRRT
jgi:hypothetical protein